MILKKWTLIAAGMIGMGILLFDGCQKKSEDLLSGGPPGGPISCDTTNVTYSGQVEPILRDNCYGCHGTHNTGPSGGILLEGYDQLLGYIKNSNFTNAVLQNGIVTPMPYGKPKLNDCQLSIIFTWIGHGYPNN
jgi:hypothetical protein